MPKISTHTGGFIGGFRIFHERFNFGKYRNNFENDDSSYADNENDEDRAVARKRLPSSYRTLSSNLLIIFHLKLFAHIDQWM